MDKISTIDSNHVIDLLAEGNIPMWIILILLFISLFMLAWIKFEPSIRSFFYFIGDFFHHGEKSEKEKEKNALAIKATLLFDKISLMISKTDVTVLSKDVGRNAFYHYVLSEALMCLFQEFKSSFTDFQNGKITQSMFCSYSGYHAERLHKCLEKFEEKITTRLHEEQWEEDKIRYTNNVFKQWLSGNLNFLSELISSSKMPTEVVMSWWVFYYEVFMNLEKFGFMLNGRLTGLTFEKIKMGKPTK
jgi:hypothetical protein